METKKEIESAALVAVAVDDGEVFAEALEAVGLGEEGFGVGEVTNPVGAARRVRRNLPKALGLARVADQGAVTCPLEPAPIAIEYFF